MTNHRMWLSAVALLSACASAPPPPPATPGISLGYATPTPPTASYVFNDSSQFEVQGGALGEIKATISANGTADIAFAQKDANVEATIRVTDFAGSFANSGAGGSLTTTEAEIEGPAIVTVSPRGSGTIVTMPKVGRTAQRVGVSESFFRRFFVRLPAREVRPGAVWVDTVSTVDDTGGTKVSVRDVVTSSFARDTVVSGRQAAFITTTTQRTLDISGANDGVEISQKLTGSGSGTVLWDTQRGVLIERRERVELKGTFDLPQMGVSGLPLSARASGHIVLR